MDLEGKIRTFLDVDVFEVLSFFFLCGKTRGGCVKAVGCEFLGFLVHFLEEAHTFVDGGGIDTINPLGGTFFVEKKLQTEKLLFFFEKGQHNLHV